MKNKILILFIFTIILSCNDDFMERYPLDSINEENFWKSTDDLKTFANQFYPGINNIYKWQADNQSDNQGPASLNTFIWNEYVVPASGGGWSKSDWSTIRSCNHFLRLFQKVEGERATIERFAGEIHFFKAYHYFEKIKRFGDVPWLSQELQVDSDQLYESRDSRKLVMDSVVASLNYAISKLPESSPEGRLTKYAALALKSRACLFEGTYRKYHNLGDHLNMLNEAKNAAEAIINSKMFSIYSTGDTVNDFHNLFIQEDLTGNPELIMFESYVVDKKMHNRVRQIYEGGTGFTKDFTETFLCTDGKPISISPLYEGDQQFVDEFKNRDPRMQQSILTPDRPYHITDGGEYLYEDSPVFSSGDCYTGYRIIKFFSPTQRDFEYQRCILDDPIFRYGEVLLNYAEAKAELGECTQQDLDISINLLRDRVGMPHMNINIDFEDPNWPDWEIPVNPLINEIRRERRIELAVEGFRFDDLRRWKAGKLVTNPKTYLGARDPETDDYRVLYPGRESRQWNDKNYLYPLPISELTLNPQLSQNPGWGN
jgi:starch-binding outer membrane protein, SusD/RagB family